MTVWTSAGDASPVTTALPCLPSYSVRGRLSLFCDLDLGVMVLESDGGGEATVVGPPPAHALHTLDLRQALFGDGTGRFTVVASGEVMRDPSGSWGRVQLCRGVSMSRQLCLTPPTPIHGLPASWGVSLRGLLAADHCAAAATGLEVAIRPDWLYTAQQVLATTLGQCAAVLVAGPPETELEQAVAPWCLLPVLSNGASGAEGGGDVLAQVCSMRCCTPVCGLCVTCTSPPSFVQIAGHFPLLEQYFQVLLPESGLLRNRATYPDVEVSPCPVSACVRCK